MPDDIILLVDDNEALRTALSRMLARNGHSVLEAHDAEEAVRLITDGDLRLSVAILDVVLPPPGSIGVLEALKQRMRPLRVLLISGYTADQLHGTPIYRALKGSEAFRFLEKPFDAEELTEAVNELLQHRRDVIEMITGAFRAPHGPQSAP